MSRARELARRNKEPRWMAELRAEAEAAIPQAPYPRWIPRLELQDYETFAREVTLPEIREIKDLPEEIQRMLHRLGVPEREWELVLGLVQVNESPTTTSYKEYFEEIGLEIGATGEASREHDWLEELAFRLLPIKENKYAAFHTAYWSGGTFIHVKAGAKVSQPIQSYFLITQGAFAQADHSLVIAEPGSEITFVEGCTAPPLARFSSHLGATEIYARPGSKVTEIVLQNWPDYVHTRPLTYVQVEEGAEVHLVTVILGAGASTGRSEEISITGQGGVAHLESVVLAKGEEIVGEKIKITLDAPEAGAEIVTKSIARDRALSSAYTEISATSRAKGARGHIDCAGLLLTPGGVHETYPLLRSATASAHLDHEAYVGRISHEILEYLRSRGFAEAEAVELIVKGYLRPVIEHVPIEYVPEINRIAELVASGSA